MNQQTFQSSDHIDMNTQIYYSSLVLSSRQVNYARFGGMCVGEFSVGDFSAYQILTSSITSWNDGSLVYTTQVNYGNFGGSCPDDFLAGFSTITQSADSSLNYWHGGSAIDPFQQIFYCKEFSPFKFVLFSYLSFYWIPYSPSFNGFFIIITKL